MFDSIEQLSRELASAGYFIDSVMIQVVFLAAKLQKPLLLEGPAGSGKSQQTWIRLSSGDSDCRLCERKRNSNRRKRGHTGCFHSVVI